MFMLFICLFGLMELVSIIGVFECENFLWILFVIWWFIKIMLFICLVNKLFNILIFFWLLLFEFVKMILYLYIVVILLILCVKEVKNILLILGMIILIVVVFLFVKLCVIVFGW